MQKKLRFLLFCLALLAVPWATRAQDVSAYRLDTGVDSTMWIPLTSSATHISAIEGEDDEYSELINIGFTFMFGGESYTQFSCNSNGRMRLGSVCSYYWLQPFTTLTNATYNDLPFITAFGMDNTLEGSGAHVMYELVGTAPNRIMVIEYFTPSVYDMDGDLVRYQIQLMEDSNKVRLVYGTTDASEYESYQVGLAASADDYLTVNPVTHTILMSTTATYSDWPGTYRYYEFTPTPLECPRPSTLNFTNVLSSTASVSWSERGTATQWLVTINPGNVTDVAYDTTYTLTGLSSMTEYTVVVASLCSNGDTSDVRQGSFTTPCGMLTTLPYFEDFESSPSGGSTSTSFANCWTRLNNGTTYFGYPYVANSTTYSHNGTHGLYWYNTTTTGTYGDYQYVILPQLDISVIQISSLTLSFWAKASSTSYYPVFEVGVMDSVNDITTFQSVGTVNVDNSTRWNEYTVSFADYTGTGSYVAVRALRPTSSWYAYVDEFRLGLPIDCHRVSNLALTNVGVDNATLTWTETDAATSWTVEYGPSGFSRGSGTIVNVSTPSITLTGLTSSTAYTAYVTPDCVGESQDNNIQFVTSCEELDSLPFFEDFEGLPTTSSTGRTFINCWRLLNNGEQYFGYPYLAGSSTYSHNGGNRGLYWYNTTTTVTYGDYQCVVLPRFNTSTYPMNSVQLRFWAKPSSTSYNPVLKVGVITNPLDVTTFHEVNEVYVQTGSSTDWHQFITSFANYNGPAGNIAVMATRPTSSWYAYVDEFTIEEIPNCPDVANPEVVEQSASSVMLRWSTIGGTGTPGSYLVVVDTTMSSNAPDTLVANSNMIIITDLEPGTSGTATIIPVCGSEMGQSATINFGTNPLACGALDPTTADTVTLTVGTETTYQLPVNNFYNYSYTQQLVLASELNASGPTSITGIDFQYGYSTASTLKTNCTIYLANTSVSSLSSGFVPYGGSFVPVYVGSLNASNGWNHYEFDTPFPYDGTSNVLIVVHDNSGAYNSSSYVFNGHTASNMARYLYNDSSPYSISSVSGGTASSTRNNMKLYLGDCIELVSCVAPLVSETYVSSNQVDIVWGAGYQESTWDVDYREGQSGPWTSVLIGTTANNYSFTGLSANTEYQFRVKANCDAQTLSTVLTLRTTCTLIDSLPYVQSFEGLPTGSSTSESFVFCMHRLNNGTSYYGYPYVSNSTTYAHTGGAGLYWYNTTTTGSYGDYQCVVMPAVDTDIYPINSLRFSFWARSSSTSYSPYFEVGVMSDPTDLNTYTRISTFDVGNNTNWQLFEASLDSYVGTGNYVVLRANRPTTSWYAYVDDLTLSVLPDCPHVTDIVVDSITTNTATISWRDPSHSSYWNLEFIGQGQPSDSLRTEVAYDSVITLTGLQPNMVYTVSITANCSGDSIESAYVTFRTLCSIMDSLPYLQTFEQETTGSSTSRDFAICWQRLNNATSYYGYPYISSSTTYNHTPGGSKGLYWYNTTTTGSYGDYQCIVMPGVDTDIYPINTLRVSFWAKSSSTSYSPVMYVGVLSDPTDISTFVYVDTINVGNSTQWRKYTTYFTDLTAGDHAYVAIRCNRPSSSWYVYVDDILLEVAPTCLEPEDFVIVSSDNPDSITLAWQEMGSAEEWELAICEPDGNPDTATYLLQFSTDTAIFPLNPGMYHVYVHSLCNYGYDTSFWVGPLLVASGFDSYNLGQGGEEVDTLRSCHARIFDSGGPDAPYSNSESYTLVVIPDEDSIITFSGSAYTESSLDVLIVYDGIGTNGTVLWRTSTSSVTESIPFTSSISGPITLRWYTDGSVTYEGFALYANCVARPACIDVDNISAASVGTTSAYLTWSTLAPTGDSVSFELSLNGSTSVTTSDPYYFFIGLDTNTSYTVRVRTICDDGEGNWDSVTFITNPMPCVEYDTTSSSVSYLVGTPGTSTCTYMPINTEYAYNYNNHLIPASVLNAPACTFSGIDFQYAGTRAMTHTTNCSIYLCHTTMSQCDDFAPVSDLQLVYTGPLNCTPDSTNSGWNHFDFNVSTFAYDGVRNIMVAVVNNSGTIEGTDAVFYYEVVSPHMTHRVQRNDSPYTLADMASATAVNSFWRPNMKLTTGSCLRTSTSCASPNVIARNITSDGADIVWAPGFQETSWDVAYALASDTTWTTVLTNTSLTSYTITGLNSNTAYKVRVSNSCSDGVFSGTTSFTTACGDIVSLPFTEDFESATTGSSTSSAFVTCWNRINNGTSYFGYPYVSSSSSYSHSPGTTRGLYWYNATTQGSYGDYQYVVLPPIDTTLFPINTLQLSFWVTTSSSSYIPVFQIGVLSDPTDYRSFVPVDTVTINSGTSWVNVEVPFNHYTGSGKYMTVMATRPSSSWYAYVDEFKIETIPSCIRPSDLATDSSTFTSLILNWTERGEATQWELAIESAPTNNPTTDSICYAHPYTVNGLVGGQQYYFYVRSICGPGDTSLWSEYAVGVPGSYNMRPNQTDTIQMCGGVIYDDGGASGAYTNSQNSYLILMPDTPNSLVSISGQSYTESTFDYLRIYDGIGTTGTELWNDYGVSSLQNFGPLESTSGPLTIYFHTDASVTYDGYEIFVSCVSAVCRIFNLRQDTSLPLSDNSLNVIWDTNGAISYEVEYGHAGFVQGTGILNSTPVNHISLVGLDPASNYDIYVRSICNGDDGNDTGSWSKITLSTELCAEPAIFYNYDSSATSTTSTYGPIGYSFYNYSYTQTIVDSAFLAGITDPIVAFAFNPYNTNEGSYFTHMDVYLANVPESNLSTGFIHPDTNHQFVPVIYDADFCYTSVGWQVHNFDTSFQWDGHSNLLVSINRRHGDYESGATFHAHNTSTAKTRYVYNDGSAYSPSTVSDGTTLTYAGNLKFFACSPSNICRTPIITSFTNDYHSATASWQSDGTNFQVNVKESVALNWPDNDIDVTTTSYTFNGLLPSTSYTIRVRQDCNADSLGYSDWAYYTFITDSLPCLVPDSLHTTAVTNATATFDWNVNGNETNWDIHVWFTGGLDSIYRVSTRPATVGGFTAGITYNASIRPLCGVDLIEGDWSDTVTFTTSTCPDVTGLTASNVTTNSVTLNWTADPMAQTWTIEYGFEGFNQGTGTTVLANTNSYVVTGLLDDTPYEFYVKANCGTDWISENWVRVLATTQSGGVTCDAPTGVNATVADNAVTVNWTANTGNISFEIEYGPRGFSHGAGTTTTATTAPAVISNLDYETQYDLYVRAICDQNTYSAYSNVVTFTTGQRPSEDCEPVSNLTVTEITDNTAHVAWTPAEGTDTWQIVVTDAQGANVADEVRTDSFFNLAGLTAGKDYTVKVRTVCVDNNFSAYVSTNFRTTGGVGISDVNTVSCTIYPNPTTSSTTISVSGVNGKVKIEVVDMNGRVVSSESLECSSDCVKTMDVDNLAQGAYFVRITADNTNMVRKLIVR